MNATIEELERSWCLDDLIECHEVLDEIDAQIKRAQKA